MGYFIYNKENTKRSEKMSTRVKSNLMLILAVAISLLIIFTPFLFAKLNSNYTHSPISQNGIADFSDTRTDKNAPIYLKGDWAEYKGSWIITDEVDRTNIQTSKTTLPTKFFNSYEEINSSLGSHSSYVLTVKNLDMQNAVIYIPHFAGSYRIFVNGVIVSQSGDYNGADSRADLSISANVLNFSKDDTYEIVVEISCNYISGLYMTPAIANAKHVSTHSGLVSTFRSIIFGAICFCTILFFVYSITKEQIFHSKWLPVLFLVIMFRLTISTEGFSAFYFIFSDIDYEQLMLLICSSTFIIKLVSLLFYTETLDIKLNQNLSVAFCFAFLVFTGVYCFFPKTVYTPFHNIIVQLATVPLDLILIGYLTDSIARKVPYSVFYTVGYIAIFSGLMVDCFYTNGLIPFDCSSYLPILCAFFVIAFSGIFIRKITEIYNAALKAAELSKQLTEANTAIMVSQIQPHFLYNALNTIKYLIKRDPKTAENAVVSFSYYLRGNMDSLTQKAPIPFTDELNHIKHYCDIELLRFGDKINIEYDIKCDAFSVPALSVQPIVENAIKHGVTKKPEGGTVKITSFEENDFYCIKIDDDGIGFDALAPDYAGDEYHAHVGLSNVSQRLEKMCNATVDIQSHEGEGTHVTIKIPRTEENL